MTSKPICKGFDPESVYWRFGIFHKRVLSLSRRLLRALPHTTGHAAQHASHRGLHCSWPHVFRCMVGTNGLFEDFREIHLTNPE
jgi:hypothetical protein